MSRDKTGCTPDVLEGEKHTVAYRGDDIYVTCMPSEVFVSSVREKDAYEASLIDMGTRLISLALRTGHGSELIKQLEKSSRSKKDIPGIFVSLLKGKVENEANKNTLGEEGEDHW